MVWITAIVALATVCLAVASLFQYLTARQQSKAAIEQAGTVKEQANVMQRQLSTMQDQANSMKVQTNTLGESLAETRKSVNAAEKQANASMSQAGTSRLAARAAEQSANIATQSFDIGERPYMTMMQTVLSDFERGKNPKTVVTLHNSGRTTALNIVARTYYAVKGNPVLPEAPDYPDVPTLSKSVVGAGGALEQTVYMFGPDSQAQRDAFIQAIKDGRLFLFVYGIVEYDDGANRHHMTRFCNTYQPSSGVILCSTHNSAN